MLQKAGPALVRARDPATRRATPAFAQLDTSALLDLAERLDGAPVPGVTLTEAQFAAWCPEAIRAEWVDGRVYLMSPSNVEHDELTVWFIRLLGDFVESHDLGSIFQNVFVRLAAQRRRRVPDVLFISKDRANVIRPTYLDGAPDLMIEIVSPDSQSRDRREKYLDYEKAGVREYWIVDPLSKTVEVSRLERKSFRKVDEIDGVIHSTVLKGFRVKTAQLWSRPLPKVSSVLRWMNRK